MFLGNNLIATTLANFASFVPLPDKLFETKILTWNNDIKEANEWDDFVEGQKVMHLDWDKENSFDGFVMLNSLSQGTSAETFQGMFRYNETITMLVKKDISFKNKLVSVGNDTSKLFFAASYPFVKNINGTIYNAKVVLMDFEAFLNRQFTDSTQGYYQNIRIGKYGTNIKVPKAELDKFNKLTSYEEEEYKVPTPKYFEWMLNEPAGYLGQDVINTEGNKWVNPLATLKPLTLPTNPYYSIVPTQFDLWAVDNYGISHPSDMTNAIKAITFTKDLSNVIATGGQYGAKTGSQGNVLKSATTLISSGISSASKFFGDARELSSETAISSRFLESEGDLLKMFSQPITNIYEFAAGDITKVNDAFQTLINKNSIANITGLLENQSTLPNPDIIIGIADSVGTRNGLEGGTKYNILGSNSLINLSGNKQYRSNQVLPFLKAPYSSDTNFKTQDSDITNYLAIGVPRHNINVGTKLAPPILPRDWTLGFRWNGFRPSPYTWINYPILFPSQMSFYDVERKGYSVGYNREVVKEENSNGSVPKNNTEYWTKGITVGDITNKNFQNPKDVFTSGSIDLTNEDKVLDKIDLCAITSSPYILKVFASKQDAVDGKEPINEYRFRTQGLRTGTSANWFSRFEL